ncbi:MAG: Cof-type HAD-IIB family hydrolase [Actinomycetota bacterium]|nr:Cof-type HAD-IIB family hydrolase [Actinomycetota bacterium]
MKRLPNDRPPGGAIRALYVDLDGTLVGPGGSMFATPSGTSDRAARAVGELHRAGVELVLVSGRTRDQMREAARVMGAGAYVAELGAFVVLRTDPSAEEALPSFGAFRGPGRPFDAMARSGAGAFLLDRYAGRVEPHTPWAFQDREATMLLRGLLDPAEATGALEDARYRWLEVLDNGVIRRTYPSLDVPEVRAYHLVPRGVNKASAVRLHRERRGLAASEAAAVGDSLSDLSMASETGAFFLVANGVDTIGAAADGMDNVYATRSPVGDGFAEAVAAVLGLGLE